MTIAEFKKQIANIPDDVEIFIWENHPKFGLGLIRTKLEVHDNADNGETISHVEVVGDAE